MSNQIDIVRFRGSLYRRANQPNVRDLWQKRAQLLDLVGSLGVKSAAEELSTKHYHEKDAPPPETVFLPLRDGRAFSELIYEMANRAMQSGYGETPAFFDQSAEELQSGIQDALTGKLIPTLKQIRQLFDELKQHPEVLRPRDLIREEDLKKRTPRDRDVDKALLREFSGNRAARFIRFRGALWRRVDEPTPAALTLKGLIIGDPGAKSKHNVRSALQGLRENLLQFRTSFREDALVAAERAAQELISLSESAVVVLAKIMQEEHELRKDVAESEPQQKAHQEHMRKRKLIESFKRLQAAEIIDAKYLEKRGHPKDLDPQSLSIAALEELLVSALEEEKDLKERARRRRINLGLPPESAPKRKIWKDKPVEEPPKRGPGRPRKSS